MHDDAKHLLPLADFLAVAEQLRTAGTSLVLTSGVFDAISHTDLHQLQQAATYGDALLVCVANDLQAPTAASQAYLRAERVAAIRWVNLAVIALWPVDWLVDALLPDVWVWHGDPAEDLCRPRVLSYGGTVVQLHHDPPLRIFRGESDGEQSWR